MLNMRLEGKLPIYEQLFNEISRLISTGEMQSDEKLPAVREVAKQFGINPNTVQKAYSQLEHAGFIYSIPAKGSYVSQKNEAAQALRTQALDKAEQSLRQFYNSGISFEEISAVVKKVWNTGEDDEL